MAKEAETGLLEILRQEETKVDTAEEASKTWKRVVLRFEFFTRSLLYVVRDNSKGIVKFKFKFKLKTFSHKTNVQKFPSLWVLPCQKFIYTLPVPELQTTHTALHTTHTASNNIKSVLLR